MRIAYAGSPPAAIAPLRALVASTHEVVRVITQPDRPRGRRGTPQPTAVAAAAEDLGLAVTKPQSINEPAMITMLEADRIDALVVVAFGQILRADILDRWPCVNVHFSLLPAYRGAAPVERAIMDGVEETGVTIMLMDAGLDTGPMLTRARVAVGEGDTGGRMTDLLAERGADLLVDALTGLSDGTLTATPQPHEGVSLAAKITAADRVIDRRRPARLVARQIHALAPHIGATCRIDGQPFKLWGARVVDGPPSAEPLTVHDGRLLLACADAPLEITHLQPPGRGRMAAGDFLRGWRGIPVWEETDG